MFKTFLRPTLALHEDTIDAKFEEFTQTLKDKGNEVKDSVIDNIVRRGGGTDGIGGTILRGIGSTVGQGNTDATGSVLATLHHLLLLYGCFVREMG